MAQEVQELINKIKQEGVQAAEEKAKEIEGLARKKSEEIIHKAKQDADHFIAKARAETKKMQESAEVALKQSARDMVLSLRKEIQNILGKIIRKNVEEALSAEHLADILGEVVGGFLKKQAAEDDIKIALSQKDLDKLKKGFMAKLQGELKKKIEFQPSNDVGRGFTISFDAGKSSFDFTDESLAEFLSAYLNPEVASLLKDAIKS